MKKFLLTLVGLTLGLTGFAASETFTFSSIYSNVTGSSSQSLDGQTATVGDVSVAFAKSSGGTAPTYYANGTAVRAYGGNTFTVTAKDQNITKITISFGTGGNNNEITATPGTFNSPTWTGSSSSVTFTIGGTTGNRRITGLEVTYGDDSGGGTTEPGTGPGTEPAEPGVSDSVTFDFPSNGYTNAQDVVSCTEGPINLTFSKGTNNSNSPKYYNTGAAIRAYGGNTFEFSTSNNYITKIEITFGSDDNSSNELTVDTGTYSSGTWTGKATNVKFTVGGTSGNRRLQKIVVTYEAMSDTDKMVSSPEISCANNLVTITCETPDAEIWYTTNGEDPVANEASSVKYTQPFAITNNTTIKAIGVLEGYSNSNVVTYNATFVGNYSNFADLMAAGKDAQGKVSGPITAIYQNGQYLYVKDNDDNFMLIYGNVGKTLSNGDQISYIQGTYSPYNNLPEVTGPTIGDITPDGPTVEPEVVALDAIDSEIVNSYIQVKDVVITAEGTSYSISNGTTSVVLYNRFTGVTIPTEEGRYNVTGFASIFNSTIQVYPTTFELIPDMYLNGEFNSYEPTEDYKLSQDEDNENEYRKYLEIPANEFSFNFKFGDKYLVPAESGEITFDNGTYTGSYTEGDSDSYWTCSDWTKGYEVEIVVNTENQTVTFAYTPDVETAWYIRGSFNNYEPNGDSKWALTPVSDDESNTEFTGTFTAEKGALSFNFVLTGSEDLVFVPYYDLEAEDVTIVFEASEDDNVVYNGQMINAWDETEESASWTYADWQGGEFTVTIDATEGTLVLTASSQSTIAIKGLETEVATEGIYNLQGVRVANPVKGQIYIVNGKKVVY